MLDCRIDSGAWRQELIRAAFASIIPPVYQRPSDWVESSISLAGDISSDLDRIDLSLTPYLIEPLNACDYTGFKREITLLGPQQMAKTSFWLWGLLWVLEYKPSFGLIIYPSDKKAEEINSTKLLPLMKSVPSLARELEAPRSSRVDCYNFSNSKTYFQGAGARISSYSARLRIADELDDWTEHEGAIANVEDLRKRARTYREALFIKVCTPKGDERGSQIWREFKHSSQGYYHLRCQTCRKLTMRSCDIHNLKFKLKQNIEEDAPTILEESSIRLVCPTCREEHYEEQKRKMAIEGSYIHRFPELVNTNVGFQFGALANQISEDLSWKNIAIAQLRAGKNASLQAQLDLDNSIKGLPHKTRKQVYNESNLRDHCGDSPKIEDIINIFLTADTQDDCYYYSVFAVDRKHNVHLIKWAKTSGTDNKELLDAYKTKYFGYIRPAAGLIDQGGHRHGDVFRLLSEPGMYAYKGDSGRLFKTWVESKEKKKLILAQAKYYQREALYNLYNQGDKSNHYLFFPHNIDDIYLSMLEDMEPGKGKQGELYENWISSTGDKNNHYFSCLKQMYVLLDFALAKFPANAWRTKSQVASPIKKKAAVRRQAAVPYINPF